MLYTYICVVLTVVVSFILLYVLCVPGLMLMQKWSEFCEKHIKKEL